jgi:cellulose synthase (UDP-forming)
VRVPHSGATRIAAGDTFQADARELGATAPAQLHLKVLSVVDEPGSQKLGLSFDIQTPDQWSAVVALMYARSENWKTFRDGRASADHMGAKIAGLIRSSLSHALIHIRAITREVRT